MHELNRVLGTFSLVLIGCALPSIANAASFNCHPYLQQRQAPEVVICETPQLSAMDEEMANIYFSTVNRIPSIAAKSLERNQREWIESRNRCGFDASCLLGQYRSRIKELNEY